MPQRSIASFFGGPLDAKKKEPSTKERASKGPTVKPLSTQAKEHKTQQSTSAESLPTSSVSARPGVLNDTINTEKETSPWKRQRSKDDDDDKSEEPVKRVQRRKRVVTFTSDDDDDDDDDGGGGGGGDNDNGIAAAEAKSQDKHTETKQNDSDHRLPSCKTSSDRQTEDTSVDVCVSNQDTGAEEKKSKTTKAKAKAETSSSKKATTMKTKPKTETASLKKTANKPTTGGGFFDLSRASTKATSSSRIDSKAAPGKPPAAAVGSAAEKETALAPNVKPEEYTTTAAKYDPERSASWQRDEVVPYHALAMALDEVGQVSGRLEKIARLRNFFRSVLTLSPQCLAACVYLSANKLAPEYEGVELGLGDAVLMKAICEATGRKMSTLRAELTNAGDLGVLAQESRSKQNSLMKPKALTVGFVFKALKEIAHYTGNACQKKKVNKIRTMLVACTGVEPKFLIRLLAGKLRIGLAEKSMRAALGGAIVMTPPRGVSEENNRVDGETVEKQMSNSVDILDAVFNEMPNYDLIVATLLSKGIATLTEECKLTPGIPMKPMLAHPASAVSEILKRFDGKEFVCEYKYDGERAQVHMKEDGEVFIYSRNSENNTSKYPDIVSRMPQIKDDSVKSFVLDCEAVAYDVEDKKILPFQVLSTRKRKDAKETDLKVQVCLFAFDLLYLNGESYVSKNMRERRDTLQRMFSVVEGKFMYATSMITGDTEKIAQFLDESIKGNCEGLMVKSLADDATYEISKRSYSWLKLKKDYLDSGGDTLDLVPIGGYHGEGKRTGTYGKFLLACYDDEDEEYQTICKIGTGFSNENLKEFHNALKDHIIASGPPQYYKYDSSQDMPDVWFDPKMVWEVKAADLSVSPRYFAGVGHVHESKGISLRFPRFMRIRDDKKPEQATTGTQVAELYRNQELKMGDD